MLEETIATLERMKERVKSIAATGAFQFDPRDIQALQKEEDWKKPEWIKVVNQMKNIRLNNEDIFFVYMFRKSESDPNTIEFVADSHSIYPYANTDNDPNNNVDVNNNGQIDDVDVLQWPGQKYPDPPKEAFLAFERPVTNQDFYEDSWGRYMSGYAPIKDSEQKTIAVLAADIQASKLNELTRSAFTPIVFFIVVFVVFLSNISHSLRLNEEFVE